MGFLVISIKSSFKFKNVYFELFFYSDFFCQIIKINKISFYPENIIFAKKIIKINEILFFLKVSSFKKNHQQQN